MKVESFIKKAPGEISVNRYRFSLLNNIPIQEKQFRAAGLSTTVMTIHLTEKKR